MDPIAQLIIDAQNQAAENNQQDNINVLVEQLKDAITGAVTALEMGFMTNLGFFTSLMTLFITFYMQGYNAGKASTMVFVVKEEDDDLLRQQ